MGKGRDIEDSDAFFNMRRRFYGWSQFLSIFFITK